MKRILFLWLAIAQFVSAQTTTVNEASQAQVTAGTVGAGYYVSPRRLATAPVNPSIQTQLDAKAPIANPTFTGTVTGNGSGLTNVNAQTLQTYTPATLPVSTATQTALDLKVRRVGTISDLKALSVASLVSDFTVEVLGYSVAGDGGGGRFYYSAESVAADNGGTVISPTVGAGRWLRVVDHEIFAKWFGVVGDRATDDTIKAQASIDAALALGCKWVLNEPIRITTALVVEGSMDIECGKKGEIYYDGAGGSYPLNHAMVVRSAEGHVAVEVETTLPVLGNKSVPLSAPDAAEFSVGDRVFVAYGVDKFDPNQPFYGYFTDVAAKVGNTLTLSDGFPESSDALRLAYDPATLAGGVIAAGDTITQGGASAVVRYVQNDGNYAYPRLGVDMITGTFGVGSISNGTATATLVAPFTGAAVGAAHSVRISRLDAVCENVKMNGLRINFSYGVGCVCSGAILIERTLNVSIKNMICDDMVVGIASQYSHNLVVENSTFHRLRSMTSPFIPSSAFQGWNQVNNRITNLVIESCDYAAISIESQCRGNVFENIVANKVGAGTNPMFDASSGCRDIHFRHLKATQESTNLVTNSRAIDLDTSVFYSDVVYPDNIPVNEAWETTTGPISLVSGGVRKTYKSLETINTRALFGNGSSSVVLSLPRGLYRNIWIYFSTSDGVSSWFLIGTGGSETGQGDSSSTVSTPSSAWVKAPSFRGYSPANVGLSGKNLILNLTGASPEGAYAAIRAEYWVDETDTSDGSSISPIIGSPEFSGDIAIRGDNQILSRLVGASSVGAFSRFTKTEGTDRSWDVGATGPLAGAGDNKFGIYDDSAGDYRLIIDSSGNIGLGTNNPSTKLAVVGTVTATAFSGPLTGNASTATALQTARTINGVSFDGTANIVTPVIGTTTNDNATAGNVGQYVESLIASGSAVSLTTATAANVTSISLTAGDWDVEGNVNIVGATATYTQGVGGITTTSATVPTDGSEVYSGAQFTLLSVTDGVGIPRKRISIAGTTTVYLVTKATFSAGTMGAYGSITARRVR